MAKANSALQKSPVQLAPVKAAEAVWRTPYQKDPFALPVTEKLAYLQAVNEEICKAPKAFNAHSFVTQRTEATVVIAA